MSKIHDLPVNCSDAQGQNDCALLREIQDFRDRREVEKNSVELEEAEDEQEAHEDDGGPVDSSAIFYFYVGSEEDERKAVDDIGDDFFEVILADGL